MENSSPSRSFFSNSASDHPFITSGHVITSNNLLIPWIGSIGSSSRRPSSGVTSPGSAGSPPAADQAQMARRNLKRILHLRSPLSSIENLSSPRGVGSTGKAVPPMNAGTKEDDVLVMDAVPIQFSRGMEEQRGSRFIKFHISEDDRRAQRPRTPQIPPPTTSTTSPLSKENTPNKEEAVQAKKDSMWSPSQVQEAIIKKGERRAQGQRTPQIPPPATSTTSPLSDEKTPEKEQTVPPKMISVWSSKKEQKAIKEWWPRSSRTPQIPPSVTSPVLKNEEEEEEAVITKREEPLPEKRNFVWPPTEEEEASITKFSRRMEEQRGSRFIKSHNSEEERRAQKQRMPQIPSVPTTFTTSPLSKENTPKKDEAVPAKKDSIWSLSQEERRTHEQRTLQIPPPATSTISPLSKAKTPKKEQTIPANIIDIWSAKMEQKTIKEEWWAQNSSALQSPPSATSPFLKEEEEAIVAKKEEPLPAKKDFMWPPTHEEEASITKVLYMPSGRKRLPVFDSICPK